MSCDAAWARAGLVVRNGMKLKRNDQMNIAKTFKKFIIPNIFLIKWLRIIKYNGAAFGAFPPGPPPSAPSSHPFFLSAACSPAPAAFAFPFPLPGSSLAFLSRCHDDGLLETGVFHWY